MVNTRRLERSRLAAAATRVVSPTFQGQLRYLGSQRKEVSVTTLIQWMREELVRRNYSPSTIQTDLQAVEAFQQHVGKQLEDLGPDDIRHYPVHLL